MRLLLDTHALVWALTETDRLSSLARSALQSRTNPLFVSAVTAYEIDYKRSASPELSRLPFDLYEARQTLDFTWIDVSQRHATRAARLPRLHRDPWDRVLIAQAIMEDFTLVTVDHIMSRYGISTLW